MLPRPTLLIEPDLARPEDDEGKVPTRARVLEALAAAAIAHFACHGASDPVEPSASLLLLHDHQTDPFDVRSLTHARLAYLSACRTAITGSLPLVDEAIHLASSFQLAGFPQVVGTLWEINDRVARQIAERFYAALGPAGGPDTGRSARALHTAIRALRDQHPDTPILWAAHLHVGA